MFDMVANNDHTPKAPHQALKKNSTPEGAPNTTHTIFKTIQISSGIDSITRSSVIIRTSNREM
jgi:hypothetical protein